MTDAPLPLNVTVNAADPAETFGSQNRCFAHPDMLVRLTFPRAIMASPCGSSTEVIVCVLSVQRTVAVTRFPGVVGLVNE